jgi:hypothetical protein
VSTNFTSTILAPPFFPNSIAVLAVPIVASFNNLSFSKPKKPFPENSGRENQSDCLLADLFRSNADGVLDGTNEDFSVADFAGLGGFHDGLDG